MDKDKFSLIMQKTTDFVSDILNGGPALTISVIMLIIICAAVIFLVVYFRNPFSFPYLVIKCDVTGRRNPTREDAIDNVLRDAEKVQELKEHAAYIDDWMKWCRKRIDRSPFRRHRLRQYKKSVPEKDRMFIFDLIKKRVTYRTSDGQRHTYRREYSVARCHAGLGELKKRYRELKKIGFRSTLNGAEKDRQRKLMTPQLRKQIAIRDNFTCCNCGRYMPDMFGLEIDHIIPVSRGGKTVPENLQVLCSECNRKKSDKI